MVKRWVKVGQGMSVGCHLVAESGSFHLKTFRFTPWFNWNVLPRQNCDSLPFVRLHPQSKLRWFCLTTRFGVTVQLQYYDEFIMKWAKVVVQSTQQNLYYCWPCSFLNDPSPDGCFQQFNVNVTKIKSSQTGLFNMTVSSLQSDDLHTHQILVQ